MAVAVSMGTVTAQRIKVSDARMYLGRGEVDFAKQSIDEAAANEETKNSPAMWSIRAAIYDTIFYGPDHKALRDEKTVENFVIAAQGCMNTEKEQKNSDRAYCEVGIIRATFAAYNKGFDYLQSGDYENAVKFFTYTLENIKWDRKKQMEDNNITEKNIHLAIADAAFRGRNYPVAKQHLQALMDVKYNDPVIYSIMAGIYLEEGDTVKALQVIESGTKTVTRKKELINQELNIYLAQNRSDILLVRVNEALASDPDNSDYLYIRGNIYDKSAEDTRTRWKAAQEEAVKMDKKAKGEKVPATKARLQSQAKKQAALADSLEKQMWKYIKEAEASYTKTIEVAPENVDGHYAMSALLNNFYNGEIVDKLNDMLMVPDTDPRIVALKKQQEEVMTRALKHANDAYAAAENLKGSTPEDRAYRKQTKLMVLESLRSIYINMNDMAKLSEVKKQIDEVSLEK